MFDICGRDVPDNFSISYTRANLAEALWEYGEDDLAEEALRLTESELNEVQILNVWHYENDPEPAAGPKLKLGRLSSRAMIEFAESRARDTTHRRRRTRPRDVGYLSATHAHAEGTGPAPETTPQERSVHGYEPPRLPRRRLYEGSYDEVQGPPRSPELVEDP